MTKRCPVCNHENQQNARFCGGCSCPLAGSPTGVSTYAPVSSEDRLNLWSGAGPDVRLFMDELEKQLSALNDDGLLWNLIGRHRAATKARELATEVVEERARIVAEFFIREQGQKVDAQLLLNQLEIDDRVQTELLNRDLVRLQRALLQVSSIFNDENMEHLHPDIRDDIAEAITSALIRRTVGESPPQNATGIE